MACPACDHPGRGYPHSCGESGTFLAAEAHAEGLVDDPVVFPVFDATVNLSLVAASEQAARGKLTGLVGAFLEDDDLTECQFTIRERVTA